MPGSVDIEANELLESLTLGYDFPIREVDLDDTNFQIPLGGQLNTAVVKLVNNDLTTRTVGGAGVFDALMASTKAHLKEEYEAGRISGAEYTKAYIELTAAAMGNAVQFLLGKEQSYWAAVAAQYQAKIADVQVVTARIELETGKVKLAQQLYEAHTAKAGFALTKMKLATESSAYSIAQYNLEHMLPAQLIMVTEQMEAQRAQTMDTRSNGVTPVTGSVGKQKALYDQQITSYKRDAEVKAAKLFTDAWITMKTIDEGVLPPLGFANTSLDQILTALKTNNDLG